MTASRRAVWTAIASVILLASTGCGSGFVDGPPLASVRLVVPQCTGGEFPPVTRVPKGFEPATALLCGTKFDGSPRNNMFGRTTLTKPFTVTTYRGDFTTALREFSRKDKRKTGECGSSVLRLPELWLIDARGLGLRPRYPADSCGSSNISGLNKILELPVLEQQTLK